MPLTYRQETSERRLRQQPLDGRSREPGAISEIALDFGAVTRAEDDEVAEASDNCLTCVY